MPDSYGVSLIRLRTRFPNKNDAVSNPAASSMAMMAWSRTGKYVSVSVLGMRLSGSGSKSDYNGSKTGVSTKHDRDHRQRRDKNGGGRPDYSGSIGSIGDGSGTGCGGTGPPH